MSENGPSTLEMLPNELLFDICKYLTARELYGAFDYLNSRFTLLIDSVPNLCLRITRNDQPIRLNFRRVTKLDLEGAFHIDLRHFSGTHSLTWTHPSDNQVRKLCPESTRLPHLRQLSVYPMQVSSSNARLHQSIFSNEFPSLRKCNLSRVNISHPWTFSPSLQSISISLLNDGRVVERILSSCPNLVRLDFEVVRRIQILFSSTFQHFNLKKLYLKGPLSLESLYTILAHVPAVVELNVKGKVHEQPATYFQHLSNTFNFCVPYLRRFDCDFQFNGQYDDLERVKSVLEQLHPCFAHRLQFIQYDYGRIRISTH